VLGLVGGEARSRNTLPRDRVTLSFNLSLPLRGILSPSLHGQGTKPVSGEFQFTFRCFPGSLLEGMDHVDALREFGHIEDSMFESSVDADFLDAGSDGGHQPWNSPTYFYWRSDRQLRLLDDYLRPVTDMIFQLSAPDIIRTTKLKAFRDLESAVVEAKLGNLVKQKPKR